jgi:hypothetical protein
MSGGAVLRDRALVEMIDFPMPHNTHKVAAQRPPRVCEPVVRAFILGLKRRRRRPSGSLPWCCLVNLPLHVSQRLIQDLVFATANALNCWFHFHIGDESDALQLPTIGMAN